MSFTATGAGEALRRGRLSPIALFEECLASLQAWQPVTNAATELWEDEARDAVSDLPRDPRGPLHGVPILIKDLFDVRGHSCTGCTAAVPTRNASRDAPVVERLRRAGAVLTGRANMHELAAGATNQVSACGPTWNPWDPERMTGGSSGGSGAAVASRSVPLALGSDTGGSIRMPSSFCGVTGLKPTHGRLSLEGVMPLAPSMDCPGPLATTAADAALAFAVMAGEEDRTSGEEAAGARGITVGVPRRGFFTERIHPDVRSAMAHVEGTLGRAGATPADTAVEGIEDAPEVWLFLCYPEFVDAYPDLDPDALLPETRFVYEFGRQVTRGDREAAMARGEEIREVFLAALADVDALLLPATPFAAPRADEDEVSIGDGETVDVYRGGPAWFTRPISISRLPSLSVPAGFDERGLPLGVQLVGRPDDEWTLLRLGMAFQAVTDHHLPAPPLPGGGGAD